MIIVLVFMGGFIYFMPDSNFWSPNRNTDKCSQPPSTSFLSLSIHTLALINHLFGLLCFLGKSFRDKMCVLGGKAKD